MLGVIHGCKPQRAAAMCVTFLCLVGATASDVAGCRATVGPDQDCSTIKPCLRAMSADCAIKTLELQPGAHAGSQNVKLSVASNESVALIGVGDAAIDGARQDWLISVVGNGSLELTNITLQPQVGRSAVCQSVVGKEPCVRLA